MVVIQVKSNSVPWVEKYRPRTIQDVSSQAEVVSVLRQTLSLDNLPHMLFYGPPGTGKTSTILALARDLFGPQLYKSRLLELNASDERGISVIREKVKNFAKTTTREIVPGYPCPPFKLIVLDEADSLTSDAQTALRRVMEIYSKGTRFCLVCNYVSRIIEPLTSRCAKFRFKPVEPIASLEKLEKICQLEGVTLSEGSQTLSKLLDISGGDLRRAITLLQSAHRLGKPISKEILLDLSGFIPMEIVKEGYQLFQSSDLKLAIDYVRNSIIRRAYSIQQLIIQLLEFCLEDPTIESKRKALVALKISQTDHLLNDGADESLQLISLFSYCQTILAPDAVSTIPAFVQ